MTAKELIAKYTESNGQVNTVGLAQEIEHYGLEQKKAGYKAGSDSIHNILMPELETQRRLNAVQKAKIKELENKLLKIKNTVLC